MEISDSTMFDSSDEESPERAIDDMNEGMVALFQSFMLMKDYHAAMEFADEECLGSVPTSYVINEIIFKIMINCSEKLAYIASDYLEGNLRVMFSHEYHKSNFLKALKDQSTSKPDIWDTFSYFVWSCLYNLEVPEAYHSHKEYVKSPNCYLLVDLYINAFLKCSIKRDILGSRAEERLSGLLRWINLYYKHNFGDEPILCSLHKLLEYIVDSEIPSDPSLPLSVKFHTANISHYMSLILNICKDVFATPENLQRFFMYTMSNYLIVKVCQYRLHELIDEKSLRQNPGMLTLKSIIDNYFFQCPEKTSLTRKPDSPRKSIRGMKLKKFSKDSIPGDTNLHECCRLGRPADLLLALYAGQSEDINKKNSTGNTPLHEACLSSSYLCCKFLIDEAGDKKVDFRATEGGGRTPLHCAVYVDAFDIVKLLLSRGGTDLIKCLDNRDKMPIDYSSSNEMKKMLQEIESKLGETESQESSVSTQLKLPNLKNSKHFHLYLRTLRSLVSNYNDIYDLPKHFDHITLPHDRKECYHYKADSKTTLCMEDSSTLETFREVIKKFIICAELTSKDENVKRELRHWKLLAAAFI